MSKVGTFVKVTFGGNTLVGETSLSLSSTANMIETSSKASGRESTFEYGRVAQTVSVESIGNSTPSATAEDFTTAVTAQTAGTKVDIEITKYDNSEVKVDGAINITGTALISDVSWEAPDDDRITFSIELQMDGNATIGTNPVV